MLIVEYREIITNVSAFIHKDYQICSTVSDGSQTRETPMDHYKGKVLWYTFPILYTGNAGQSYSSRHIPLPFEQNHIP